MMIVEVDEVRRTTPDHEVRARCMDLWAEACSVASRAVIMCGPPGAGKSTWLREHAHPGVAYYDGTCTWPSTRAQLIRIAKEHGLDVEIVVLATDLATCITRNRDRPPKGVADDQIADQWRELHARLPAPTSGVRVTVVP